MRRCLIIDDEFHWRKILCDELKDLGFECFLAKDDEEAIQHIKLAKGLTHPFDLITLDRELEGIGDKGGTRVLSFLKKEVSMQRGKPFCIVISGTSSDINVRDYFKNYLVEDFLSKTDSEIWEKLHKIVWNLFPENFSDQPQIVSDREGKTTDISSKDHHMRHIELVKLRQAITTRFDEGEIRTLCFDLGIDYENLSGVGKANKVRELINFLENRNLTNRLIEIVRQLRSDF